MQAGQRESVQAVQERKDSEDEISISASEEEGGGRRHSGKRIGAALNFANKGMASVGRGLSGTFSGTMNVVKVGHCFAPQIASLQRIPRRI